MSTAKSSINLYNIVFCLIILLADIATAQASTLTWNRNVELGVKDYQVYACTAPGCTVAKVPTMLVGTVAQPIVGDVPKFVLDLTGKTGQVAVTARTLALVETGLSNVVSFAVSESDARLLLLEAKMAGVCRAAKAMGGSSTSLAGRLRKEVPCP
jgi:hypothetical protein